MSASDAKEPFEKLYHEAIIAPSERFERSHWPSEDHALSHELQG